jgi:hypothetical protein
MKRILSLCCVVLFFGCAPQEQAEEPAVEQEMSMTMSLADVAGEWSFDVFTSDPDSAALTVGMMLSDTAGSSMMFDHLEEPVPVTVKMMGDTLMTVTDPYSSAFREGVMVTTKSTLMLVDGNMEGGFVAKYDTEEADSVLAGTLKGVRK